MTYEEAIELAYNTRWKTSTCSQGEKCWCRTILPETPINYKEGGTDFEQSFYILNDGALTKEFAEYFVKLHNDTIDAKR